MYKFHVVDSTQINSQNSISALVKVQTFIVRLIIKLF